VSFRDYEGLATAWDAKEYLEWIGNCYVITDATEPFRDVNRGVPSQNPLDAGELETPRLRTPVTSVSTSVAADVTCKKCQAVIRAKRSAPPAALTPTQLTISQ